VSPQFDFALARPGRAKMRSMVWSRTSLTRFSSAVLLLALESCAGAQKQQAKTPSADEVAARAQRSFDAGDEQRGIEQATRALVMRIARHGIDHRETARSFLQLGDMRRTLGQRAWARQSYRRGLEVLAADPTCTDPRADCSRHKAHLERALRQRVRELDRVASLESTPAEERAPPVAPDGTNQKRH
jgi:hypothetical protein